MFIIWGPAKHRKCPCGGTGPLPSCSMEAWEDSSAKQADFQHFQFLLVFPRLGRRE